VDQAIALFAKYDPQNASYAAALANAAMTRFLNAEYQDAEALSGRAISVAERLAERDDSDLAVIYSNHGDALSKLGRFSDAEGAYDRAADLARRTSGEQYGTYWRALGLHASMLYLHGDRERALAMLESMLAAIPSDWKATTDDTFAREAYAACLTLEGRSAEAVPLLETALQVLTARPRHDYDLRRLQSILGDAYDAAGRIDAARAALQWALRDYDAHEPRDRPAVLEARERWGRFLIEHPRGAEGDAAAAVDEVDIAARALREIQSDYDVRIDRDADSSPKAVTEIGRSGHSSMRRTRSPRLSPREHAI